VRVPWKLIGLAGVASVAASGAVVVRRRRGQEEYDPEALREKLHERLAETRGASGASGGTGVLAGSGPAPEAPEVTGRRPPAAPFPPPAA